MQGIYSFLYLLDRLNIHDNKIKYKTVYDYCGKLQFTVEEADYLISFMTKELKINFNGSTRDKMLYFHFIYSLPNFSTYIDNFNNFMNKYEYVKRVSDTIFINNTEEKQHLKDTLSESKVINAKELSRYYIEDLLIFSSWIIPKFKLNVEETINEMLLGLVEALENYEAVESVSLDLYIYIYLFKHVKSKFKQIGNLSK